MNRVKLTIAYNGTAYHGWQIQNNGVTVQETIQNALHELFSEPIAVHGASRTDAGVHAKAFVAHADLPRPFPLEKLPLAMNAHLPFDIGVLSAEMVSNDFHARFSCRGKTYSYRLVNSRLRNPLEADRAGFWPVPLSADHMNEACKAFVGRHDFTAFMATGSRIEDAVREIYDFAVHREGDIITFTVTGNGFLYNMVRIMVGTLIYDDLGKLDRSIAEVILSRDRKLAGITVPPQGLYLDKVYY